MRIVVAIATCLLWNAMLCFSSNPFSSGLKPVVGNDSNIWIYGPNGRCAHVDQGVYMVLRDCEDWSSQHFTFNSDGTIRFIGASDKCIILVNPIGTGTKLNLDRCDSVNANMKTWKLLGGRQIMHQATGLVLSAFDGGQMTRLTLEKNMYSTFQTWLPSSKAPPPARLANIIGRNGRCLRTTIADALYVGACEANKRWYIYPDGSIRPEGIGGRCISIDNLSNKRVIAASCGMAETSERWLFTKNGTVLNEGLNLVWEVVGSDQNNRVILYPPAGGGHPNQQWKIST